MVNLAIWAGSLLVAGSAVIHFYLWDSQGYRNIPTIGPLFLAQACAGWALAMATAILRKLPLVLVSAGYGITSACALIYSVLFGLFGWQEVMSAPYVGMALAVEFAAGAVLLAAAAVLAKQWLGSRAASVVGGPHALVRNLQE